MDSIFSLPTTPAHCFCVHLGTEEIKTKNGVTYRPKVKYEYSRNLQELTELRNKYISEGYNCDDITDCLI